MQETNFDQESKEYLFGYSGLAIMLKVCRQTASKLTKEKLSGCYFMSGKKIIFIKQRVINRLRKLAV